MNIFPLWSTTQALLPSLPLIGQFKFVGGGLSRVASQEMLKWTATMEEIFTLQNYEGTPCWAATAAHPLWTG